MMESVMLPGIASFVLVASVKGTVLIALVLALQFALLKMLPANWRYLLWFTVIAALATPVGYEAALLPERLQAPLSPEPAPAHSPDLDVRAEMSARELAALPPFSAPARSTRTEASGIVETLPRSWPALLSYFWLAGVLAVFSGIARSGFRFARLVHRAHPVEAGLREILDDCMHLTSCARTVTLLQSAEVAAPMIAGHWRPVLLLPEGLELHLTRPQLRHVFVHELMHLQRGDIVCNWIVAGVQALHWFNPVVWIAFFRMRQDRELACDAATLRHLAPTERAAYGTTLLQLNDMLPGIRVPALAVGMLHGRSHLHQRILMLAGTARRSLFHKIGAPLVFAPLAALAFSLPAAQRQDPDVAPPPAPPLSAPAASAAASAPAEPVAAPVQVQVPEAPLNSLVPTARAVAQAVAQTPPPASTVADAPAPAPVPVRAPSTRAAPEPLPPAEPAVEPLDIEPLSAAIATTKADSVAFIEKWEAIGQQCAAREGRFLGALSASCQRIRTAQRRGEVFRFAFACYQLNTWQEQLVEDYRSAAPAQEVEAALHASGQELATFCSKDTYASQYPAFAAMIADAEALKYYPRSRITAANIDLAQSEAYGALYRYDFSFNTANSMARGASIGNIFGQDGSLSVTPFGGPPAGAGMGNEGGGAAAGGGSGAPGPAQ